MAYISSNKEGHQDRYYSFSSKIYFVGYSLEGAYNEYHNLFLWRNKEERKTTYGEREREREKERK